MIDRISGRTPAAGPPRAASRPPASERFQLNPPEGATRGEVASGETAPDRPSSLRVAMNRLEAQRGAIDSAIRQAARGKTFSPAELLVLQSRVYTYSQELEVVSRMVDRVVSSVKTTLNTQV